METPAPVRWTVALLVAAVSAAIEIAQRQYALRGVTQGGGQRYRCRLGRQATPEAHYADCERANDPEAHEKERRNHQRVRDHGVKAPVRGGRYQNSAVALHRDQQKRCNADGKYTAKPWTLVAIDRSQRGWPGVHLVGHFAHCG